MNRDSMSDHELDRLFALASKPAPLPGAEDRFMAKLNHENIVAFRSKSKKAQSAISWIAALPLAASLAFGVWLGAAGIGTNILPESLGGDAVAAADVDVISGIDEAETLAEDDQT
jgi:hypothetical protein